jgi:drug/metabolite transporter, DME family
MTRTPPGAWWIIAAAVLWSTAGAGIKLAPMPAMAVACGRALVALIFYLLVLRPPLRRASLPTALGYAGVVVTFVVATKTTTAANAIFLQYLSPAYVLVGAPLFLGEPFRRGDLFAVAVALIGMTLFFVDRFAPGSMLGNVVAVICGLFCAATALLLRRDATRGDDAGLPSITLGNAIAAAVTLPFAWHHPGGAWSAPGLLTLVYLGVVQMGCAYLCFLRGLRTVRALDASLLSLVEAALNPIWALLLTGERPGSWAVIGGVLILASGALRTLLVEAHVPMASELARSD